MWKTCKGYNNNNNNNIDTKTKQDKKTTKSHVSRDRDLLSFGLSIPSHVGSPGPGISGIPLAVTYKAGHLWLLVGERRIDRSGHAAVPPEVALKPFRTATGALARTGRCSCTAVETLWKVIVDRVTDQEPAEPYLRVRGVESLSKCKLRVVIVWIDAIGLLFFSEILPHTVNISMVNPEHWVITGRFDTLHLSPDPHMDLIVHFFDVGPVWGVRESDVFQVKTGHDISFVSIGHQWSSPGNVSAQETVRCVPVTERTRGN